MPKKEKELKNEFCTDCIIVCTLLRNQIMQNLHIDEEGKQLHEPSGIGQVVGHLVSKWLSWV